MKNTLDLREYHMRHKYTPYRRFMAFIGTFVFYVTLLAVLLTGIFYG